MNKYQREKTKRMRKLSDLGIPYYKQKKFIKIFNGDFVKLDESIAQIEKLKWEQQPKEKKTILSIFKYIKKILDEQFKVDWNN